MASLTWNKTNESLSDTEPDGATVRLVRGKPMHDLVLLEIQDTLFLAGSCIALPADGNDANAPSLPSLLATALRHAQEVTGQSMLIAGHCDGNDSGSLDELAGNRAELIRAMLVGDRDAYIGLCTAQDVGAELAAIFAWAAKDFAFACAPASVDTAPDDEACGRFRSSFNDWLDARDSSQEEDPRATAKLETSGGADEAIWGAVFDLFEYSLRQQLGENAAGVAALRENGPWVDEDQPSVGFADSYPIDGLESDQYRSQTSRRVEILYFDEGDEPDDPAAGDIYRTDRYLREHVAARDSNLEQPAFVVHVRDCAGGGVSPATVEILRETEVLARGSVDGAGDCQLLLTPAEGLLVRVTGIHEKSLPAGDAAAECAGTAAELADGIACPSGSEVEVAAMLLDFAFTLERTQIDAQARTATLETGDGSYKVTQELPPPPEESLTHETLFTGIPTCNQVYTLTVDEAGQVETVFSCWSYQRLMAEIDKSLEIPLEEPGMGLAEDAPSGQGNNGGGDA